MKSYVKLCIVVYHRSMRSFKCSDRALTAYGALCLGTIVSKQTETAAAVGALAQHLNVNTSMQYNSIHFSNASEQLR